MVLPLRWRLLENAMGETSDKRKLVWFYHFPGAYIVKIEGIFP